jgi:hypothetical protein
MINATIDLAKEIVQLLSKIIDLFRKEPEPREKHIDKLRRQETSERIDEEDEPVGELTMIADKILERLNNKNRGKK